jgi:hypothetical protein
MWTLLNSIICTCKIRISNKIDVSICYGFVEIKIL